MKKILTYLLLIFFLPTNIFSQDIIDFRKNKFQENKDHMRDIYTSLKKGDFNKITFYASKIETWAQEMENYFPKHSISRSSSKEIWLKFDEFKFHIKKNEIAANNLKIASIQKDLENLSVYFDELGNSCKSCHNKFKN